MPLELLTNAQYFPLSQHWGCTVQAREMFVQVLGVITLFLETRQTVFVNQKRYVKGSFEERLGSSCLCEKRGSRCSPLACVILDGSVETHSPGHILKGPGTVSRIVACDGYSGFTVRPTYTYYLHISISPLMLRLLCDAYSSR